MKFVAKGRSRPSAASPTASSTRRPMRGRRRALRHAITTSSRSSPRCCAAPEAGRASGRALRPAGGLHLPDRGDGPRAREGRAGRRRRRRALRRLRPLLRQPLRRPTPCSRPPCRPRRPAAGVVPTVLVQERRAPAQSGCTVPRSARRRALRAAARLLLLRSTGLQRGRTARRCVPRPRLRSRRRRSGCHDRAPAYRSARPMLYADHQSGCPTTRS